ncbi:MAG: peroxiredoxin [Hyphomicrobiaceae bacterium]|nr:peroxiredoxin [Hyphomicrobiaceae bacterium]
MAIAVGDMLPDASFKIMTGEGPAEITVAQLFTGRKAILFAVPGAFTPTCHVRHLPGYIENYDKIRAAGVQEIAVVAVNDVFVMDAWKKSSPGAEGKVTFLADGSADFAKAIGMELDATAHGLGIRSKRYAMVVDDRKVVALEVEDVPSTAERSGAAAILDLI